MQVTSKLLFLGAAIHLVVAALPLSAAVSVNLSHPSATSQPVGTAVTWTATNAGSASITLQYRWVITQNGANVVFRDFNTTSTISYAPLQEGPYTVTVTARDAHNLSDTDTGSVSYAASPLVAGSTPKVTATHNPLVAIYSAMCPSGSKIRVFFAPNGTSVTSGVATPIQPCVSGKSVNFIIAGMRASTTYKLAHQIQTGFTFSFGPTLQFTTGSIPASVPLPTMTVTGTPTTQQSVILEAAFNPNVLPMAFDTSGHVIWYNFPPAPGGIPTILVRPLNGGTMLLGEENDVLQQMDLLGNILRETNITRMSEQLSKPPFNIVNPAIPNRLASFSHDAIRLSSGNFSTIAVIEQIANQGQGPVDVLGDLLLVLDDNFQLVWAWDAFAHLNIKRKATLNDTCAGPPVCPPLKLIPPGQNVANDWLHGNSLAFTGDGNLLFSLRNQDWVIKIHYGHATGTANGDVLWRLGNQGDFNLVGGGQWFSHQHNATLTGTTLSLFDNANGDETNFGGSRGLVFTINEQAKTADIMDEALMHIFSGAVGTAQILLNGNLWFLAGLPPPLNGPTSRAIEFKPGSMATPIATFDTNNSNYRSFRMKDLYTP